MLKSARVTEVAALGTLAAAFVVAVVLSVQNMTVTAPSSALEMPVPLNTNGIITPPSDGGYFNQNADYGYFSTEPDTIAYREVNRALEINASAVPPKVDTHAEGSAQNEPIKRVSIFDQWSDPIGNENPATLRFNATAQKEICDAKCVDRPGWHPSAELRHHCIAFCQNLYDVTAPSEAKPQPAQHSWWLRRVAGPGSQLVRYKKNSAAGAGQPVALSATSGAPVRTMLFQERGYRHRSAVQDLNSFFDSLPTKGCTTADCNTPVVVNMQPRRHSRETFKASQVREYERKVLGYHRKQEDRLASQELHHIQMESGNIVSDSMRGYEALQKAARNAHKHQNAHASTSSAHVQRSNVENLHSKAYNKAKHEAGFVGYYDNVFAHNVQPTPVQHPVVAKQAQAKSVVRTAQAHMRSGTAGVLEKKSLQSMKQQLASMPTATAKPTIDAKQVVNSHSAPKDEAVQVQSKELSGEEAMASLRRGTMTRTAELLRTLSKDVGGAVGHARGAASGAHRVLRLTGGESERLEQLEEEASSDAKQIKKLLAPISS